MASNLSRQVRNIATSRHCDRGRHLIHRLPDRGREILQLKERSYHGSTAHASPATVTRVARDVRTRSGLGGQPTCWSWLAPEGLTESVNSMANNLTAQVPPR